MRRSGFSAALLTGMLLPGMLLACGVAAWSRPAVAQVKVLVENGCGAEGYRVVGRRWDALLGRRWELRQDCRHPEWPARLVAMGSVVVEPMARSVPVKMNEVAQVLPRLLVHAGDRVRLWQQDEMVRIEMIGVVEQSARSGDHVVVQITRQSEDSGMTVERVTGTVRGSGDVEMER